MVPFEPAEQPGDEHMRGAVALRAATAPGSPLIASRAACAEAKGARFLPFRVFGAGGSGSVTFRSPDRVGRWGRLRSQGCAGGNEERPSRPSGHNERPRLTLGRSLECEIYCFLPDAAFLCADR